MLQNELGPTWASDSGLGGDGGGQCSVLMWYCVVMLMSLFTLLYYIYIVTDFFTQMKFFVDPADLSPDYESRHSADPDEGKYYTVSKQKPQGMPKPQSP